MQRRWLSAMLLALALVACDALPGAAPKGPTGVVGDIARTVNELLAPGVDVTDARFEAFLADMDLVKAYGSRADEITAQIRSGRASVTKPTASGASAGGRLASVPMVFGESIVLDFAKTLAGALDDLTKASGTHEFPRLPPATNTTDGATTVTQSSRGQSQTISSAGARVTLTIVWTYRETTKDKTSGATLSEIVEERTMTGAITVCPDPLGAVGAFVDAKSQFTGSANGQTTTLATTSSSVFTGHVSEGASLQNVHHVLQDRQSWETSSGNGHYEATFSGTSAADSSGSTARGLDSSSVTGGFTASSADALARGAKAAAWSFVLDGHSLDEAYQKAQRLWRNGRCIMVTAPDYSAQTPIEVADQEKRQHDEEVSPSSETKIVVNLKHRFENGVPSQPIVAALTSGGKSVEPNRIESVSTPVTYKAPDEDDKSATLLLRTTSKRGIGTLVLDFHTGGGLHMTINGELSGNSVSPGIGVVRILDTVTIGPVKFKKSFGDQWEGSGTWQAQTSSFAAAGGATSTCTGSQRGTITMTARLTTRGEQKFWVLDPLDSMTDGTATSSCPGEIVIAADVADIYLGMLNEIVLPAEGGRVQVSGSMNAPPRGTWTATGTATGRTSE